MVLVDKVAVMEEAVAGGKGGEGGNGGRGGTYESDANNGQGGDTRRSRWRRSTELWI